MKIKARIDVKLRGAMFVIPTWKIHVSYEALVNSPAMPREGEFLLKRVFWGSANDHDLRMYGVYLQAFKVKEANYELNEKGVLDLEIVCVPMQRSLLFPGEQKKPISKWVDDKLTPAFEATGFKRVASRK